MEYSNVPPFPPPLAALPMALSQISRENEAVVKLHTARLAENQGESD